MQKETVSEPTPFLKRFIIRKQFALVPETVTTEEDFAACNKIIIIPNNHPFMKLLHILEKYDTTLLDQISADKVDEAINLRLPQPVIVNEIISALSSQSYISNKILYDKPPTFAILNLILQSPDFIVEAEGFRTKVLDYVNELSAKAAQNKPTHEKNTLLYIKILKKIWENDGLIDKSEAQILELVKQELGIWEREHFIQLCPINIGSNAFCWISVNPPRHSSFT